MPPHPRPGRRPRRSAALTLAALLALLPWPRAARAEDVLELMAKMDKAFSALVQNVLVLPVQNLGTPPFGEAAQEAARIVQIAGEVLKSGAFPGDQAFPKLAQEAQGIARQVEAAAKGERLAEAAVAVAKLQSACMACHKDYRF